MRGGGGHYEVCFFGEKPEREDGRREAVLMCETPRRAALPRNNCDRGRNGLVRRSSSSSPSTHRQRTEPKNRMDGPSSPSSSSGSLPLALPVDKLSHPNAIGRLCAFGNQYSVIRAMLPTR
ncbi:unnamed protein product [Pleuronectes platessa]|uniref:Uncharacterized protein n=1 Tax=Pleuronectes platessa TaxID=8262 RepID=A0A9N7V4T7_PLEPL|nr:unnamed protein product [Pleuronectes platessa]